MENLSFSQWFPLVLPLILLEVGLVTIALVDLVRRERTRGPRWVWVLLILFVSAIGPILYFMVGRED